MRLARLLLPAALLLVATRTHAQQQAVRQQAAASAARLGAPRATRRAIEAVMARFVDAYNKGDVAAVAQLYTEDALLMPQNSAVQEGRSAIEYFWNTAWKAGMRNLKLTTTELGVTGNIAVEVGTYSHDVETNGAITGSDQGKYIVIWTRDPKKGWQLYRDIFNSDLAAAK